MGEGQVTFSYGVHPPDSKQFAADAAIEVLPCPAAVQVPVLQHLGAPCAACVKPKDEVKMGDKVGEAQGFISSPVHSSINGKVGRESAATLPNGRHVPVIPIKADGEQLAGRPLFDEILGGDWPTDGLDRYEPKAISDAALDAGIVGLGGAAFPTHVKLLQNPEKPIDTLLINGAECEPFLTADYRLMLEAPAPVITGALLAMRANGATRVVVGIEDNKPQAIATMREAADGTPVEILPLKTKYPQGGEKQLIVAVLGREVPTGGLPLDVGVVVMNVGTCAALARAVVRGKALTHRVITVSGAGIRTPKNILAPIGAAYQELVDFCGGLTANAARIVSGGPMMGFAMTDLSAPVTKGTSGITILTEEDVRRAAETSCVRCGRCVDVCPLRLVPTKLALASRHDSVDVMQKYHINACMECGCCGYVCPASLPLVQLIRVGKVKVRNASKK